MTLPQKSPFGAIRWRPIAGLLVLLFYLALWLVVGHFWGDWLAPLRGRFANLDDATFREYATLALSCVVKLIAALAVLLVICFSRTPLSALGTRLGWPGLALLTLWVVLLACGWNAAFTDVGRPSSRPGEPPLTTTLVLTTLLLRGVINPFAEELIFRTFLYLTLRSCLGGRWGMLLSILIFALWHFEGGVVQMTVAALMGGLLTAWYELSRSLPQIYLAHSSLNLGRLLLALSQGHL